MSNALPLEAAQYVDEGSTLNSIRNLLEAVTRGEISLSTLVQFTNVSGSGETPRFAKRHPVPVAILNAIRIDPERPPRQVVYSGWHAGFWTEEDVLRWEHNESVVFERGKARPKAQKGIYLTKSRRAPRTTRTENLFVPKMPLDIYSRHGVCDGAKSCLAILLAFAGKASTFTTYTSSIATTMKRTTRTVRNYFAALESAGLIARRAGKHFNTVTITISQECRLDAYVEPVDVAAFKAAKASSNPALHLMAMGVVMAAVEENPDLVCEPDRRKAISVFNLESNSYGENWLQRFGKTLDHIDPKRMKSGGMSPPTTHSTLLVDPRRPINPDRRQQGGFRRAHPSGGNGDRPLASPRYGLPSAKIDDSL
jgi:hypothetical protein